MIQVNITPEQIKELQNIRELINSNDTESTLLGCNLLLQNYPSGMIDAEFSQVGYLLFRNYTIEECIDLGKPFYIKVWELTELLSNVIKQKYYIISERIFIVSKTEDNA